MQGQSTKAIASRNAESVELTMHNVLKDAQTMGLTPEIQDLIDTLNECKSKLTRKATELSALEAIAMESRDKNISDLREQLFAVVKMVHSDILDEVMAEFDNQDKWEERAGPVHGLVGGGAIKHPGASVSTFDESYISKYDILERMRRYLNKRAEYKAFMKAKNN